MARTTLYIAACVLAALVPLEHPERRPAEAGRPHRLLRALQQRASEPAAPAARVEVDRIQLGFVLGLLVLRRAEAGEADDLAAVLDDEGRTARTGRPVESFPPQPLPRLASKLAIASSGISPV